MTSALSAQRIPLHDTDTRLTHSPQVTSPALSLSLHPSTGQLVFLNYEKHLRDSMASKSSTSEVEYEIPAFNRSNSAPQYVPIEMEHVYEEPVASKTHIEHTYEVPVSSHSGRDSQHIRVAALSVPSEQSRGRSASPARGHISRDSSPAPNTRLNAPATTARSASVEPLSRQTSVSCEQSTVVDSNIE
jgi:hypothetical protein